MKKIVLLNLFLFSSFFCFSQDIAKIEICAVEYDATFYMPPLLNRLLELGLWVKTTDRDIGSSRIESNIISLEQQTSKPVDSMQIEGNTRAIVKFTYEDETTNTMYLLGVPDCDIVWKDKQYKMYYPILESVYYFYPERYFKKEKNWNHYRRIQERKDSI